MKKEHIFTAEVAALAGRIMLESHAESYRIEDTVRRILKTTGLSYTDCISTTTGLYITLDDELSTSEPLTIIRRIYKRGNHLSKIYQVNNISRMLTNKEISLEEAYYMLMDVRESEYSVLDTDAATVVLVMGFVVLLGGSLMDMVLAFFAGILVALCKNLKKFINMNSFIHGIFSTFVTSLAIALAILWLDNPNVSRSIVTIAAFMPLYPGTAVTNGIRDTLKGDYVAGIARITDAVVIATSLAIGVALAIAVYGVIFG